MSRRTRLNRYTWIVAACVIAASAQWLSVDRIGHLAFAATAAKRPGPVVSPRFTIPPTYRDWKFISAATLGSPVSDIRAKLGNDAAIAAFRDNKVPFPDGAVIARLAWKQAKFKDSTDALREEPFAGELRSAALQNFLNGSIVAGHATTVQFMIKNSKKYPSTGGWGFFQATNGKLDADIVQNTCFACHAPGQQRDFVFTRYAR